MTTANKCIACTKKVSIPTYLATLDVSYQNLESFSGLLKLIKELKNVPMQNCKRLFMNYPLSLFLEAKNFIEK